jgi:hypothetical protein
MLFLDRSDFYDFQAQGMIFVIYGCVVGSETVKM